MRFGTTACWVADQPTWWGSNFLTHQFAALPCLLLPQNRILTSSNPRQFKSRCLDSSWRLVTTMPENTNCDTPIRCHYCTSTIDSFSIDHKKYFVTSQKIRNSVAATFDFSTDTTETLGPNIGMDLPCSQSTGTHKFLWQRNSTLLSCDRKIKLFYGSHDVSVVMKTTLCSPY